MLFYEYAFLLWEYNIPIVSSRYWTSLRSGNDVSDDDIIEIFCKSTRSILKAENRTTQAADMLQTFLGRSEVCFKSSSTAAVCILGLNVNGRKLWKNASGKSILRIQ